MSTQLKEMFADLDAQFVGAETHAGYNLALICKATPQFEWKNSHYTADSIVSTMTDPADGKKYRVEIKPLREKSDVNG